MRSSATFAKRDATISKTPKRRLPSTAAIKVVNKAIKKTLKEFDPAAYQCSLSIPGIDPVMAAEILSEIVGSMRSNRRSLWRNTPALSGVKINPAITVPMIHRYPRRKTRICVITSLRHRAMSRTITKNSLHFTRRNMLK